MDPLRIAVRASFAYVFLLTMVRLSGNRTVGHGSSLEFVLALTFADLVDDLIWAEVAASQFVAAAGTLFIARLLTAAGKMLHLPSPRP